MVLGLHFFLCACLAHEPKSRKETLHFGQWAPKHKCSPQLCDRCTVHVFTLWARRSYTILYHFPFQIFDSWRIYFFPPHRKLLNFGPNTRESTILDETEPDMYLTSTIFFYHIIMKLKSRKLLPTWTVAEQKRGLHHPTVFFRVSIQRLLFCTVWVSIR